MEPKSKFEEELEAHIQLLRENTEREGPRLIDYVYLTTDEKINLRMEGGSFGGEEDAPELEIYLPEVVAYVLEETRNAGAEYQTFEAVWEQFAGWGYERITDESPINVLDLAIVWLSVGMNMESRVPPFRVIEKGPINLATIGKSLMTLIDRYVDEVVDHERDTAAVFSKKLIIESALDLESRIQVGIISQRNMLRALNLIRDRYLSPSAGLSDLPAYDDELISVSYSMYLTHNEGVVPYTPSLEYAIFEAIQTSEMIPFCSCNMDEVKVGKNVFKSVKNRFFKVHAAGEDDLARYHKNGWVGEAEPFSIVLFVFIGENLQNATSKDFAQVTYSYKKSANHFNKFTVTLRTRELTILMERLNRSLTGGYKIVPVAKETENIVQEFVVPGLELDKDLFMHLVSTDVTAATLLRFKELENPWTLKKIIKFSAFLLGDITVKIRAEEVKTSTRLVRNKDVLDAILKGDKIVIVTISARNIDQYGLMRFFALKLLAKYVKDYDRLLKFHNFFFKSASGGLRKQRIEPLSELGKLAGEENDFPNIKLLRHADPEVWWNANYARPVAPDPDLQVKPIREDEITKYTNMGRDVIRWPVRVVNLDDNMQTKPSIDPRTGKPLIVYYTTTTNAKPHITLVPNPGQNSKTHPLLPKCQQSSSDLLVNKSKDWEITMYKPDAAKTTKEAVKTLKILDAGRFGPVHGSIMRYLQAERMTRLGVRRSQSSFLHCALYALEEEFRAIYTTPEADQRVEQVRELLPEFAAACMQENPDRTVEEVAAELGNPLVFLDPSRHYRAVEEAFGVGIFTAVANDNKELVIEAPPYKGFYTRSKRQHVNDCIVILKLEPQQSKVNRNYQCELLGANYGKVSGYTFSEEVLNALEKAVDALTRNIVVEPSCQAVQSGEGWRITQTISAEISTTEKIVLSPALRGMVVAQKLDGLGKLRALKLKVEEGREFWCLTQPLEPLGGARLAEIEAMPAENIPFLVAKYLTVENKEALRYTPKDDRLVGVWMFVENLYVFIPVVPIPWKKEFVPVRFDSPYVPETTESITQEHSRLRRVMAVMLQIVKRLFAKLYLEEKKSGETTRYVEMSDKEATKFVENFVAKYMAVESKGSKMTVAGCSHLIPLVADDSFSSLKHHFAKTFPTLFTTQGKIRCDSFELLNNFTRRLHTFLRVIRGEEKAIYDITQVKAGEIKVHRIPTRVVGFPRHLEEFYVTVEDFTNRSKDQMIFVSTNRYITEMKMQEQLRPTLVTEIEVSLLEKRTPYFFLYEDDDVKGLYLVQNVQSGDSSRAATLASYWVQNKVNLGYDCPGHIAAEAVVELKASSMKITDMNVAMIVYYDNGEAAALLSLNANEEPSL